MAQSFAFELARLQKEAFADAKMEGMDYGNGVMTMSAGLLVAKDQKCANLEINDEVDKPWALDSTACSSTSSSQRVVRGAMIDAVESDMSSGKDSSSTPDVSDCDNCEGRRWADFELDDEVSKAQNSFKMDSGTPYSAWPESIDQNWSPENWSPEMHGWQWVPVAVVPMPWAQPIVDSPDFSQGHTCVSDLKQVLDARKPAKDPRVYDEFAGAWKKAEQKKSEEKTKRTRTKKRAALSERSPKFPKVQLPQSSAPQSKGAVNREPTTIMIRNIPQGCTRAMLQSMFASESFEGQYDFLYLPYSFDDWSILGHAFVNFLQHCDAERAVISLNDRVLWPNIESKPCQVCWSKALQGLAPCIGRFRNSPVMHRSVADQYKPMLFTDGHRCDFPEATRPIQPVRRTAQSQS